MQFASMDDLPKTCFDSFWPLFVCLFCCLSCLFVACFVCLFVLLHFFETFFPDRINACHKRIESEIKFSFVDQQRIPDVSEKNKV